MDCHSVSRANKFLQPFTTKQHTHTQNYLQWRTNTVTLMRHSDSVETGGVCPIFITISDTVPSDSLCGLSWGGDEMLLVEEMEAETGVGGAGERQRGSHSTCISACNSYLQLKCPSGPVWKYCACVCVCVWGIPSNVDRALPTDRPVLNI